MYGKMNTTMYWKFLQLLVVVLTAIIFCVAKPDLATKGNVDFYRVSSNITATWKQLDKLYVGIDIKYCDVTASGSPQPCLYHKVMDAKVTMTSFRVVDYRRYNCSLVVHESSTVNYTSPPMAAKFRPNMTGITFTRSGGTITGKWNPFGPSYTSLEIVFCVLDDRNICDRHQVANTSKATAAFPVNKDKKYRCSVVVIDVTGEVHSSSSIEPKDDNSASGSTIIIIIVVVVIVVALIIVAVVLYFVLKNYCQARESYSPMPKTEREAKRQVKRIRKHSVDELITEKDFDVGRNKREKGEDNEAFVDNDKGKDTEKKNGAIKGPKVKKKKKKTKYEEPTIEFNTDACFVEIDLNKPDTISLSSQGSQGDKAKYPGGDLVIEIEADRPDVAVIPELDRNNRKMSTDLDADCDVIVDADVSLDIKVDIPVEVTPVKSGDGPYVKMEPRDSSHDPYVKMELPDVKKEGPTVMVTPPTEIDLEKSSPSETDSEADQRFDGELASRGSIDMADARFQDARYDGSFDLRFAGISREESLESDDLDLESKPGNERLDSDDDLDVGTPPHFNKQNSVDSVQELDLNLAYGADFNPKGEGVDVELPPIDVKVGLDVNEQRGKLESTDTVDVDPSELQFDNDVNPDHVTAVIDADRDGGLIHVQDGSLPADVEIPVDIVQIGTPEENIGDESDNNSEKTNSHRNEPVKRGISRKCSKLRNADHVCSHVQKEHHHSRSDSSSSLCSTCASRSAESSSPTFSRSYSSSGSDTEKDIKDIEEDEVELHHGDDSKNTVGFAGVVDAGHHLDGGVDNAVAVTIDVNADVGMEGDAVLSAPAGFADEINIGAEDPDVDIDLAGGLPKSTGLNLKVDLGLDVSA